MLMIDLQEANDCGTKYASLFSETKCLNGWVYYCHECYPLASRRCSSFWCAAPAESVSADEIRGKPGLRPEMSRAQSFTTVGRDHE